MRRIAATIAGGPARILEKQNWLQMSQVFFYGFCCEKLSIRTEKIAGCREGKNGAARLRGSFI